MKDKLTIPKEWTFKSADVAKNFDAHVQEQLPWYGNATNAVAHLGRHFITKGSRVYDIGASTGNIGNALRDTLVTRGAAFVAIDDSPNMEAEYKGPDIFLRKDAVTFDYKAFEFATCFLVLMFLPVDVRASFVSRLAGLIKPGGALVIVDKMEPLEGYMGTVFSRLTMQQKLNAGANPENILRKELSLAGYQRPINPSKVLPPKAVQFFQMGEFGGWVIEGR